MAETYAALLRRAANDLDYARDEGHSTIPRDDAAQLRALADLLERVTPEVVSAVCCAGPWPMTRDALEEALAILNALAAGPQSEEGREHA